MTDSSQWETSPYTGRKFCPKCGSDDQSLYACFNCYELAPPELEPVDVRGWEWTDSVPAEPGDYPCRSELVDSPSGWEDHQFVKLFKYPYSDTMNVRYPNGDHGPLANLLRNRTQFGPRITTPGSRGHGVPGAASLIASVTEHKGGSRKPVDTRGWTRGEVDGERFAYHKPSLYKIWEKWSDSPSRAIFYAIWELCGLAEIKGESCPL